jgi:hypothetical protein
MSCADFGENLVDPTPEQCQSYATNNGKNFTHDNNSLHPKGCKISPWHPSNVFYKNERGVNYESWRSAAGGYEAGNFKIICRKNTASCN